MAGTDKTYDLESRHKGIEEFFNVEGLPKAVGFYKHVHASRRTMLHGGYVYLIDLKLSGMLPLDADGNLVGGDYSSQTEKVLDNIAMAIQGAASHYNTELTTEEALASITDTFVFLKENMSGFKEVNDTYARKGMPKVARAAVAPNDIPLSSSKGTLVEIVAYATIDDMTKRPTHDPEMV